MLPRVPFIKGRMRGSRKAYIVPIVSIGLSLPIVAMLLFLYRDVIFAQATPQFDSGSNGVDGALDLTDPVFAGRTLDLIDDRNEIFAGRQVDPEGDHIYHFTTVNIPPSVTLRLSGRNIPVPVYWLAQGEVVIDGLVDLQGKKGHNGFDILVNRDLLTTRTLSEPGAGGFAGGFGGNLLSLPIDGFGPTGGASGISDPGPFLGPDHYGQGAGPSGNRLAVPLRGGSGGGGSQVNTPDIDTFFGTGGGAGGGAILIASSQQISVDGSISATGGDGGDGIVNVSGAVVTGGGGSGGVVRLIAPIIRGNGKIEANAGNLTPHRRSMSSHGIIRIETFRFEFVGTIVGGILGRDGDGRLNTVATPFDVHLPTSNTLNEPAIRVTGVGGVGISANPTGSFVTPDATITDAGPVTIDLQARNIPPGTVLTIQLFSEDGVSNSLTASSTPLVGTFQLSTGTAQLTLPRGFSQFYVEASWTP